MDPPRNGSVRNVIRVLGLGLISCAERKKKVKKKKEEERKERKRQEEQASPPVKPAAQVLQGVRQGSRTEVCMRLFPQLLLRFNFFLATCKLRLADMRYLQDQLEDVERKYDTMCKKHEMEHAEHSDAFAKKLDALRKQLDASRKQLAASEAGTVYAG